MANKRDLKKAIEKRTYEVVSDCLTHGLLHPEHKESSEKIMHEVLHLREDLLKRVNHDPQNAEEPAKTYYRRIQEDLQQKTHEFLIKLSELVQSK